MTLIVGIVALALSFAVPVSAFECPQHFAEAQTAIDRATEAVKTLPMGEKKALVHALLDDAKMLLHGGKHNHEKPQGAYDHARAIAKADAARGHAEAAGMLATR